MVIARRARPDELPALLDLRRRVFVEEQGVPLELDVDGLDGDAVQLVALAGDAIVGTARVRAVDGHAKAERVAVDVAWRGLGVGKALMDAVAAVARVERLDGIVLGAQETAVG